MRGSADERPSRLVKESRRFGAAAKALGARVRELRKARAWTLEQAAERMLLDLKHLQKVEAGNPPVNVTLATLLRIADGLDVTVAELFSAVVRKGRAPATSDARPGRRSPPARRGPGGSL
jgi:transcriptional regulator with XRE-family HTH domain